LAQFQFTDRLCEKIDAFEKNVDYTTLNDKNRHKVIGDQEYVFDLKYSNIIQFVKNGQDFKEIVERKNEFITNIKDINNKLMEINNEDLLNYKSLIRL